jgi:hypothetical protein
MISGEIVKWLRLTTLCVGIFQMPLQQCRALASPQQPSTLKVHVTGATEMAVVTARLYFPKSPNQQQKALQQRTDAKFYLANADDSRTIQFPDLAPGNYLLEVYSGSVLVYQKELAVPLPSPMEIPLSTQPVHVHTKRTQPVSIQTNITLRQFHRALVTSSGIDGAVAVYIGAVNRIQPITFVIFKTGVNTAKWQDNTKFYISQIHKTLPKDQLLFDGQINPGTFTVPFEYSGLKYVIMGVTNNTNTTHDYSIHFDIQR